MATRAPSSSALPDRNILAFFAAFVILIGGGPVAVRIGYAELAPFWLALTRFGLGAAIFWVLALFKGLRVPKGRALIGAMLYGTLGVGISMVLMGWGMVETPASLTSTLMAMVPLITVLLSVFQGVEPFSGRGLLGSLIAVAGIVIALGGAASTDISLPHVGAILLGTGFLAQSGIVIKRFPSNPPIMTNAIAMTVGAMILGIVSLATGEAWVIPSQFSTWAAFGYLVVFVTVIAFMFYLRVLNNWSASGTSYGFVLIPLVTVIVAAVLANEQITINFLIGAALVLAGVLVGALLPSRKKTTVFETCRDSAGQVVSRCI
ncbi:MAG: EamA family transporter [Anaerolineales bacterium]